MKIPRRAHHSPVVSAKRRTRHNRLHRQPPPHFLPQVAIRRNAPAKHNPLDAVALNRIQRPLNHAIHSRLLELRRHIRNHLIVRRRILRWRIYPPLLSPARHRRLQPAKAEIKRVSHRRTREPRLAARAMLSDPLYLRPPRKPQPQRARRLVKRLPRRVIPRPRHQRIALMPPHQYQVRMPPRRYQAHQRKARRHIGIHALQPRRIDMPLQVIKPDKRQFVGIRETLRGVHSDKQRTRQARPMRNRHAIQLMRLHPRVRQRLPYHRRHSQHMLPRRHLRHNPPIPRVQRRLRRHHIGTNNAPILNHRRRRLIARRLNPQYLHLCSSFLVFRMNVRV